MILVISCGLSTMPLGKSTVVLQNVDQITAGIHRSFLRGYRYYYQCNPMETQQAALVDICTSFHVSPTLCDDKQNDS